MVPSTMSTTRKYGWLVWASVSDLPLGTRLPPLTSAKSPIVLSDQSGLVLMVGLRVMLRWCWVFVWLWWQYWTYFMEDYLRFNLLLLELIMKIILYCLYLSQFDTESYLILQVQSESYYFTQHYLSPDPSFYNCHLPVYNYPNINHTPCTNTTN